MSQPLQMLENHFCSLQSQTNVYGLSKILMPSGLSKILVASLRGQVICLDFPKFNPSSREVHFTYIPGGAEIVSIDAFNKSFHGNGVVVGITFIKGGENKVSHFLNIYSDWEPGTEFNIDMIAQGCNNLELDFVPFQLSHTELSQGGIMETVFLLSGNDQKVHLFREERSRHMFCEQPIATFFPEFTDIPSNVTWMDILHYDNHKYRLTSFGCQTGFLQLTVVATASSEVIKKWTCQHDGPITGLKLFNLYTEVEFPSFLSHEHDSSEDWSEIEKNLNAPVLHLAVTNALEVAVVYRNVTEKGFSDVHVLPNSKEYDSALCVSVHDVDFDGMNEILVGTYGQELLIYKFFPKKNKMADELDGEKKEGATRYRAQLCEGEYVLWSQRSYAFPLLQIDHADITGDGMEELVIVSLKGLHILQHDLEEVSKLCLKRLKRMTQRQSNEDIFQQLQAENLSSSDIQEDTQGSESSVSS